MQKEYTKLRQFYAWVGFIVIIVGASMAFGFILKLCSKYIVDHSLRMTPTAINNNLS